VDATHALKRSAGVPPKLPSAALKINVFERAETVSSPHNSPMTAFGWDRYNLAAYRKCSVSTGVPYDVNRRSAITRQHLHSRALFCAHSVEVAHQWAGGAKDLD